jgi:hypothetical protein
MNTTFDTNTVEITVGDTHIVFRLPRYPLCTQVPVISNMVTGCLEKRLPASLFFPQFDPYAFKTFTDWATTDTLPLYTLDHKKDDPFDCWSWNPYRVYNLGEWFMLPALMDVVMDRLVVAFQERKRGNSKEGFPSLDTVREVFSYAPPNSTLRTLMVEIFCYNIIESTPSDEGSWSDTEIVKALKENKELIEEVMKKLRGCCRGRAEDPLAVSTYGEVRPCRWHIHESEISPTYECMVERRVVNDLERDGEMGATRNLSYPAFGSFAPCSSSFF